MGEAHRRGAGAPDGEGRGDHPGRTRLSAVLGEQGRSHRRQQDLPARLRPRVPDPGAGAQARGRRRFPAERRPGHGLAPALSHAAQAAVAAMGDPARAAIQPAAVAGARGDVHRAPGRVAVQPRPAQRRRGCAESDAAADALPGHQPHAGRLCAAADGCPSGRRCASANCWRCASKAAPGPQVAVVRWFRNTMRGNGLEFGCEVLSDNPEAAAAALEGAPDGKRVPVVVLPPVAGSSGATTCCRRSSSPRAPLASIRAWR